MGLRELRSFATLADLGNITHTAERLNLTPPAIHKQLRCLEAELGVRIYEKVGRRLQLTQGGEVALPYVSSLLANYDALIDALNEWKGARKGLLRLGCGPATSTYILPPLLREFRRRFPGVDLFVETGNTIALLESLKKGELDSAMIVSAGLPEDPTFSVEKEWLFEIIFVAGPQSVRKECRVSELSRFPFLLFKKGSRLENSIDRYFARVAFHPRIAMRFDNPEAIKAMIRTGLGISVLPVWAVQAELNNRSVRMIRQREPKLMASMILVTRKSQFLSQPHRAFLDLARDFKWKSPWVTKR